MPGYVVGVVLAIATFAAGRASRGAYDRGRVEIAAAGGGEPPTCIDRPTLAANANLVEQASDYRKRVERGIAEAKSDAEATADVAAVRAHVVPTLAEWRRMARDRTIRVRMPCASWQSSGSYWVARPSSVTGGSDTGDVGTTRALAAGLSAAELDALGDAYERTRARTWTGMRAICERSDAYRRYLSKRGRNVELTDSFRLSACIGSMIDIDESAARTALEEVVALRARGAGAERARSDEERVAFTLTGATATLYEEMVHAIGMEATTRALDHGLVCFDENVYDLRDQPEERAEAVSKEPAKEDEPVD